MSHFPVIAAIKPQKELKSRLNTQTAKPLERVEPIASWIAAEYILKPLLEPYEEGTENPCYQEFVETEVAVEEKYRTGTLTCIRFPEGRIRAAYEREFYSQFQVDNGRIYQTCSGPLHHPRRSKKAKKLELLPEYPIRRYYPSIEQFAEKYYGFVYNEEIGAYGSYSNPNAKWDWYQVGGRWPYEFLVKSDCQTVVIADRRHFTPEDIEPAAPDGYRWVCGARKADIQWDLMKKLAVASELARYEQYRVWFDQGEITGNASPLLCVTENGIVNWGDLLYRKGETAEEHLARKGLSEQYKFPCDPFALVDEDGWQEYGEMGWFGMSTNNVEEQVWRNTVEKFLDALPMDALLITVDCHI